MERAHVLIRLRDGDRAGDGGEGHGVSRTSATTVRLEHSAMSPGVASITFERVFDAEHSTSEIFTQSLAPALARVLDGQAVTLVATGAVGAGKTFSMHGDGSSPGLVPLAIASIFAELQVEDGDTTRAQVLLSSFVVHDEKLWDAVTDAPVAGATGPGPSRADADVVVGELSLLHAWKVGDATEALELYGRARSTAARCGGGDDSGRGGSTVVCLSVETQSTTVPGERRRRGRLVFIDLHGSAIVEPACCVQDNPSQTTATKSGLFVDTHFPIERTLSAAFGGCLGGSSATIMLVAIQKPSRFQQQAIQSLLFACKAKDIRSTCTTTTINEFTVRPGASSLLAQLRAPASVAIEETTVPDESEPQDLSSDDSDSHDSDEQATISSPAVIVPRRQPTKEVLVSQRLREAYRTIKATKAGVKNSRDNVGLSPETTNGKASDTTSVELQSSLDDLIASISEGHPAPEPMSTLEKIEFIRSRYEHTEAARRQEASIKEKCVERISKLSQTMTFQATEHEKHVKLIETSKLELESRLREMEGKYTEAEQMLTTLRKEVDALKQAPRALAVPGSKQMIQQVNANERVLLQQFSARLEAAMLEAKGVVSYKDQEIRDLKNQLAALESEAADLRAQTLKAESIDEADKLALRDHVAALEKTVDETRNELLTSRADFDTEHAKWAQEREAFVEAAERGKSELAESERQLKASESRVQVLETQIRELETQAEIREQRLTQAMQAAVISDSNRAASERTIATVEDECDQLRAKLAKDRRKWEKKLKALLAKQDDFQRERSEAAQRQSELVVEVESLKSEVQRLMSQAAIVNTTVSEQRSQLATFDQERAEWGDEKVRLRSEVASLQGKLAKLMANQQAIEDAEASQKAIQQRFALQLLEREAAVGAEYEGKLHELMERHSKEILERDCEIARLRELHQRHILTSSREPLSGSSSSSSTTSSGRCAPFEQRSLEHLPEAMDTEHGDAVGHRRLRRHKRDLKQEDKIATLRERVEALTLALADANEQETWAKEELRRLETMSTQYHEEREGLLEQMNRLKQENWSLNLALEVSDRRARSH